jgi:hypothetical protein
MQEVVDSWQEDVDSGQQGVDSGLNAVTFLAPLGRAGAIGQPYLSIFVGTYFVRFSSRFGPFSFGLLTWLVSKLDFGQLDFGPPTWLVLNIGLGLLDLVYSLGWFKI